MIDIVFIIIKNLLVTICNIIISLPLTLIYDIINWVIESVKQICDVFELESDTEDDGEGEEDNPEHHVGFKQTGGTN